MKQLFLLTTLTFGLVFSTKAQTTDLNKPRKAITDASIVANQKVTWSRDTVYVISGFVYAEEGSELTIQAGTVIKAREGTASNASALIISRGAKIFAQGTALQPIIFTTVLDSVALPDYDANDGVDYKVDRSKWGGLVLLGKASNNVGTNVLVEGLPDDPRARYGGTDDADNSGVVRYVSIKYSGTVIESNRELQGLTLASVGSGTTIEYVESFNSGDDGFEFFGGTANTKYLISAFADDDAFDYDEGFRGKHQFWFAIQAPANGDNLGEYDGGNSTPGFTTQPYAYPYIFNATYIGSGRPSNRTNIGLRYKEYGGGEHRNTIFADIAGSQAIRIDSTTSDPTYTRFAAGEIKVTNNIFFNIGATSSLKTVAAYLGAPAQQNRTVTTSPIGSIARTHDEAVKLNPLGTVETQVGGFAVPDDGFFTPVSFIGAFGNTNWAAGWTALAMNGILTTITVDNEVVRSIPTSMELSQNYPNPFNPTTSISFSVPTSGQANVSVFDMNGRAVATLVNGFVSAGSQTVSFDASGLSSGVYMYRLQTSAGVLTRKMTLMK